MPPPLFVFLVSGRPAGGSPPGTDDTFARCAWLRVAELVRVFHKNRKKTGAVVTDTTVLRFIHFASHDSSVGIYEHDFATMANRVRDAQAKSVSKNWRTLDNDFKTKFGSLTPKTEDPKDFVEWKEVSDAKAKNPKTWGRDDDPSPNVSIVNVYHSVRKAPAGSVLELSIFSHAFVDGPVLNNTSASSTTARSPGDTDGRAFIDFQTNMGESGAANAHALDEFRKAFAPTGSFRIWGCNIQDLVETTPPPDDVFRDFDIADTAALITKLQSDTDPATTPVSQFLFSKIDLATKKLFADPAKSLPEKQTALVKALNKILNGSSIGDKTRFAGVTLRPVTQSLLTQTLSFAPHRISQNRLLLEDAYPSELNRRAPSRCLIMSTVRQVVEEAFVSPLKVGGSIGLLLRDNKTMPSGTTNITLNMDREIDHELSIQTDPFAGHGFSSFVRFRLFEIRYDESFANHAYHDLFRGERTGSEFAKKITRTLSDIVKFIAAETTKSYFFLAAKGLKTVTVVGGGPGTSAELDSMGQQIIGPARLNEAKFFSQFFGVSITDPDDEIQRHYAILDNQGNAVKTILDREKNGLP
jgi:hypothetical protein